jgi:hypothetical protein
MAASQAAFKLEQAIGHDTNATTAQDVSNPANVTGAADPSGEDHASTCVDGQK